MQSFTGLALMVHEIMGGGGGSLKTLFFQPLNNDLHLDLVPKEIMLYRV